VTTIERVILGGVRRDLLAPERVERMAEEIRVGYAERMREIAARAETLPHEIQELDARITRLRERLKAGDPDLMADELQAGIERAETKRRELLDVRPADRENARVLALMPRAAELYREQIDLGLGGDLAVATKARTILREMLGEIMLSPEKTAHCGLSMRCSRRHCCKAQEQLVGVTGFNGMDAPARHGISCAKVEVSSNQLNRQERP
jgi:hypothetical protein